MILGVDTASVGGNSGVDWAAARDLGNVRFAILRATWGTLIDHFFLREWQRALDADLVVGAYLFLRFPGKRSALVPPAAAQVDAFCRTLDRVKHGSTGFVLPPTVDVEFPGAGRADTGMSAQQLLFGVIEACQALGKRFGCAPIVYTSARVWREDLLNMPAPELVESPLWLTPYPFKPGAAVVDDRVAHLAAPPTPPTWGDGNWWIHQYQGDAVGLPGFPSGNLDMNRFNAWTPAEGGERATWVRHRLKLPEGASQAALSHVLASFQSANGCDPDAVIGPRTFARLAWR